MGATSSCVSQNVINLSTMKEISMDNIFFHSGDKISGNYERHRRRKDMPKRKLVWERFLE